MIWWAAIIGLLGLALSSLFSGSETGFYRATRLRLVLDSIAGDWVSRGLLWLVNRPALFVATALVGNNLANYLVSLGVVICAQQLFGGEDHAAELIAPLVLAPLLFVYGELLPKNLFLQAPNRLLRRVGPVLLGFTVLFLPLSGLLWGLNRLLAALIAEPPERVRRRVARRELRRAVAEGHEAGILRAVQVALAEGVLGLASQPVARRITPLAELPRARADMTRQQVLTLARRYRVPLVCVESASRPGELIGYVRVIDLGLSQAERIERCRPLLQLSATTTHLSALMQLEAAGESIARVVNKRGRTLGVVTLRSLREAMLRRGHLEVPVHSMPAARAE